MSRADLPAGKMAWLRDFCRAGTDPIRLAFEDFVTGIKAFLRAWL